MSKLRFRVVETAFKKKAATVETPAQRPGEYFAKYVFLSLIHISEPTRRS